MARLRIHESTWHCEDQGARELPPILFLHGFTGCAEVWDEIVAGLSSDFRCIRVDLPGHGGTQSPSAFTNFQMDAVCESLDEMLSSLEVGRTNVWGYSMGGRLALHFALRYPGRIQRLVLESASPGIADPEARRERAAEDNELADQIEAKGIPWFVEEWLKRPLFASLQNLPEEKQARGRQLRQRNQAAGLAASLRGMGTGAQEPLHDRLSSVTSPTMILAGEYDVKFRAIGLQMAGLIPLVLYCLIPHAGHAPSWEQPESCVRAVRDFLLGKDITMSRR